MSKTESPENISFDELSGLTAEVCAPGGGHGPIAAGINARLITEFRGNSGKIAGEVGETVDLLLLTVTGAKNWQTAHYPVGVF
jgi:hypothetical protein